MFVANMPPPSSLVRIPPEYENFYQIAGPLFLCVAAVFFGVWASRYKSLLHRTGRVYFLASIGFAMAAAEAIWVWTNRDAGLIRDGYLPHLVGVWIGFYLAFLVSTRYVDLVVHQPGKPRWPEMIVLWLMGACWLVIGVLSGGRQDKWFGITMALWLLLMPLWGVMSLIRFWLSPEEEPSNLRNPFQEGNAVR